MNNLLLIICFGLLNLTNYVIGAPKLPDSVKLCKRKDPNVHECVKNAIQDSLSIMSHGVNELGIEILDPLKIDHIDIDKKRNDGRPVDIDLTFKDVTIDGISKGTVESAKADWDNNMVSMEMKFDSPVVMKGRYIADGVVLILPIVGEGVFEVSIEGLTSHLKVHGKTVEKSGENYMEVDRVAWTFDAQHMSVKMDNLFNGDKKMAETMNQFLNENWRDVMVEMTPAIEASFSSHFKTVAEKVFNQIPIDSIALP